MLRAMTESTMPSIQMVAPESGGMEIREVPVPTIGPGEVLIKVRSAAICGSDLHLYQWHPSLRDRLLRASDNFSRGLTAGHEFCGHVVEIGPELGTIMGDPEVKLEVGDFVSAESHVVCGKCYQCLRGEKHVCVDERILGFDRDGAFARYIALPASCIWKNDPDLPFEIAAIQEPLGNAMHAAAHFPLKDKSVVIYGLGPIGLFAAVIAVIHGARKVIAVEVSEYRIKLAEELGVHNVIRAAPLKMTEKSARAEERARVQQLVKEAAGEDGPDVALEMSGHPDAISNAIKSVRRGGAMVAFGLTREKELTLEDYSGDIIFKGLSVQGVVGRRIYDTWYKVRELVRDRHARTLLRKVITGVRPYAEFREGFTEMIEGLAGKIVLEF